MTKKHHLSKKLKLILGLCLADLVLFILTLLIPFKPQPSPIISEINPGSDKKAALAFTPSSIQIPPNTTKTFQVILSGNEAGKITAADVEISYDSTKLSIEDILPKKFLPTILTKPTYDTGKISFTFGAEPTQPRTGSDVLAEIVVKSKSNQTSKLSFTQNSQIAMIGTAKNTLSQTHDATINAPLSSPELEATSSPRYSFEQFFVKKASYWPLAWVSQAFSHSNRFAVGINAENDVIAVYFYNTAKPDKGSVSLINNNNFAIKVSLTGINLNSQQLQLATLVKPWDQYSTESAEFTPFVTNVSSDNIVLPGYAIAYLSFR